MKELKEMLKDLEDEVFELSENAEWIEHYSKKMAKLGLVSALVSYGDLDRRRLVVGGYHGNDRNGYAFGVRFVRPLKVQE